MRYVKVAGVVAAGLALQADMCPPPAGPPPELVAVTVTATPQTVAVSETTSLAANATFSDGGKTTVTLQAVWESLSPAVLSVAAPSASAVLGTGLSEGSARVKATYRGMSGFVDITVQAL